MSWDIINIVYSYISQFIIEGQKQKSYLSDISIDDVSLYNCSDGKI
jgi:hypothetical protein